MSEKSVHVGKPGAAETKPPVWRRVAQAGVEALDVFFPPSCVSCFGLVEANSEGFRFLCGPCARKVAFVRTPHCTTCGYPFYGAIEENTGCVHCETLKPIFTEGRTLGLLRGPLRRLVHSLKYERALHVLNDVSTLLRLNPYFCGFLNGAVLVPVPLHPRKQRERGFNQALLLAECFAGGSRGSTVKPLIQRVIDTPSQTRLDRSQRKDNLKNAFAMDDAIHVKADQRYVLVDDVFTTGATLNACASVLRKSGVTVLDVATLGHG